MSISPVGTVRFVIYGLLLLVNTVVLGLSGHINHFQAFFYKADVFPLALSVVTTVFVLAMIFLDINLKNSVTARPPFELGWLLLFGTLWLAFNAFSTSRWKYASMGLCRTIPSDAQYAPYRTWCHELQALRAFVWIEWVMFLLTFAFILHWAINKHTTGRHDVWSTAISRFSEYDEDGSGHHSHYRENTKSEFLQWEKFPSSSQQPTQQDFTQFTRPEPFPQSSDGRYPQPMQAYYPQQSPTQPSTNQYLPPSQSQFTQSRQESHEY